MDALLPPSLLRPSSFHSNHLRLHLRFPRPSTRSPLSFSSSRAQRTLQVAASHSTDATEDPRVPPSASPSPSESASGSISSISSSSSSSSRRGLLLGASALAAASAACGVPLAHLLLPPPPALALIPTNAVAGRVPGLSQPDERGWRTYTRPANKSGGHGIGWSELIPYSFSVPEGWEEVPVSIADLGGTEIDLRFNNKTQGKLAVIVAPVLRFSDTLGSDARIEKIGTPEKVVSAFGPEVVGESVEGKVLDMGVVKKNGLQYYQFEIAPHVLMSTTAAGNRLYILAVEANGRQWKKFEPQLREILSSFTVG